MREAFVARVQSAVGTALVCAALTSNVVPLPANAASYLEQDSKAASARLQRATLQLTDSARSVLKAQTAETLFPFASSVADILLATSPDELAKLVDASLDTALSVPSENTAMVTKAVKEAYSGVSADSCELVPFPSSAVARVAASDAVARADPAKAKAVSDAWSSALKTVPRRGESVCLPPTGPKLDSAALAQLNVLTSADTKKLAGAQAQAQATVKSVKRDQSFKLFSTLGQQQRSFLGASSFPERDRFKKASGEFVDASVYAAEIRQKRAEGPPKCFTIGCTTNFEYDIWRNNPKDDYTGEGLERPAAILSPKGISKEDLEKRAQEFKAAQQ